MWMSPLAVTASVAAAAIVCPPDLPEDFFQQERVAVPREDMHVWPIPDDPPERRHLVGREVDQEVLLEGRLNEEGVEGGVPATYSRVERVTCAPAPAKASM